MTAMGLIGYFLHRSKGSITELKLEAIYSSNNPSVRRQLAGNNCSYQSSEQQLQHWVQAVAKDQGWLSCPDHKWLRVLADQWTGKDMVVYDIGCNKGYEVALLLELFKPQLGVDSKLHFQKLKQAAQSLNIIKQSDGELCGPCGSCNQQLPPTLVHNEREQGHLHVHCFEPSQENFKLLQSVRDSLVSPSNQEKVSLDLYNLAVSQKPGVTQFPTGCSELCSLGGNVHNADQQNWSMVDVNVTTVDIHMKDHKVSFIDVLKIDTEGFDPWVLLGASSAFERQQVGVLLFEHHSVGLWKDTDLKDVVERLRTLGYVCFYDGKPTLTQLTGCWEAEYAHKRWSNVRCVLGSHPNFEAINALSFNAQLGCETQGKRLEAV